MTFNILILPLIYSGVASSISLSELESLYPIMIFSMVILAISFLSTLILGILFGMRRETYFIPLCIASTFPNIVALPIIIFPTLCEYDVVQDLVREDVKEQDIDEVDLMEICKKQVNAIVFTYFFGFSVLFWSFGYRALTTLKIGDAGVEEQEEEEQEESPAQDDDDVMEKTTNSHENSEHHIQQRLCDAVDSHQNQTIQEQSLETKCRGSGNFENVIQRQQAHVLKGKHCCTHMKRGCNSIKEMAIAISTSTGFIALVLGFVTSCIEPLQSALFQAGGSLRVLGSALESLSSAGTTFATMIVAASLVNVESDEQSAEEEHSSLLVNSSTDNSAIDQNNERMDPSEFALENGLDHHVDETQRENVVDVPHGVRCLPMRLLKCSSFVTKILMVDRNTMMIDVWQILARLFVTPGIIFAILLEADCSKFLEAVPNIAKLVLLVNAAVPGALVVVVILKAEGFTREAAAVSKTYLPSYTLSVFTLAMWSSLGMMAFHPNTGSCSTE